MFVRLCPGFIRSDVVCLWDPKVALYFRGSGWSEELLVAPVLRHRKGLHFLQAAVSPDSSAVSLGTQKCYGRNNVWDCLFSLQENPDAATRQADEEDVSEG